jgi:putative glutathione S-transferase
MSGYLDRGRWRKGWYDTRSSNGEFVRTEAAFRNQISADGSSGYRAEAGRYHLYVSLACPWAHRTVIYRVLKGLEDVISMSVVDPVMHEDGWEFSEAPGCIPDTVSGFRYLRDVYTAARRDYSGRVTVPVLWDKGTRTIVNNESAEIIRMFDSEFGAFIPMQTEYYPVALRSRIDTINEFVYERVNNGVYRCGFAGTQGAYDAAFARLFTALDELEARLGDSPHLTGEHITEADWRLFTTLLRFDAVYYVHFKCNLKRIADYPNLSRLLRELYHVPGVAETVNMDHIKRHYYLSHPHLNPSGIVPAGPLLDFE